MAITLRKGSTNFQDLVLDFLKTIAGFDTESYLL